MVTILFGNHTKRHLIHLRPKMKSKPGRLLLCLDSSMSHTHPSPLLLLFIERNLKESLKTAISRNRTRLAHSFQQSFLTD